MHSTAMHCYSSYLLLLVAFFVDAWDSVDSEHPEPTCKKPETDNFEMPAERKLLAKKLVVSLNPMENREEQRNPRLSDAPVTQSQTAQDDGRSKIFEQCPVNQRTGVGFPAKARTRAESRLVALAAAHNASTTNDLDGDACNNGTLIGDWSTSNQYQRSCCRLHGFCGGCAQVSKGKCVKCAAGYKHQGDVSTGKCFACDDVLNWKDATGKTCKDFEANATCSNGQPPATDHSFKGLRPSDACCVCGGGQVAATPWKYKVSDKVLVYGQHVSEVPSPETAQRDRKSVV